MAMKTVNSVKMKRTAKLKTPVLEGKYFLFVSDFNIITYIAVENSNTVTYQKVRLRGSF